MLGVIKCVDWWLNWIEVRYPKRFKVTTDSNHNDAISPNLLNRQFDVAAPNKVWTTDITYVWTLEGWLYVALVIDLFSRQVVGWAIDDTCGHHCVLAPYKWLFGEENRARPASSLRSRQPKHPQDLLKHECLRMTAAPGRSAIPMA